MKRLASVLTQLHVLLTVATKASSICGPLNSRRQGHYYLVTAQINVVTCKNSELMAGSQYPQTTRSLLKTGLLLNYHITIVLVR